MSLQVAEQEFNPMHALHLARPKGYTVLNSTTESYTLTFAGNSFVIPPAGTIVEPHPKFNDPSNGQFVPHSATYRDTNDFIPGTLIVHDLGPRREGEMGEDGDTTLVVTRMHTANEFLQRTFGVDEYNNYSGEPFRKGLSILGAEPTKAEVLQADRAGKQRYKEWLLRNATSVIRNYEDRCASAERNKLPNPQQSRELLQAKALLEEQDAAYRKTLFAEAKQEDEKVQQDLERPVADVQEISDERLLELMKERDILMKPSVRKELSEDLTIRKRRVPKSKQVGRNKKAASKTGRLAKSAKILVPED